MSLVTRQVALRQRSDRCDVPNQLDEVSNRLLTKGEFVVVDIRGIQAGFGDEEVTTSPSGTGDSSNRLHGREEDPMSRWTRRDLLRATAASAAVVPAVGLRGSAAHAAGRSPDGAADDDAETFDAAAAAEVTATGPLMVCVHDADGGDVSILHGTEEVVVRDRRLVAKIVRAKSGATRA